VNDDRPEPRQKAQDRYSRKQQTELQPAIGDQDDNEDRFHDLGPFPYFPSMLLLALVLLVIRRLLGASPSATALSSLRPSPETIPVAGLGPVGLRSLARIPDAGRAAEILQSDRVNQASNGGAMAIIVARILPRSSSR
jgi:hypothetical protein